MSNYVKSTNFTAKDSLPSGNSGKIVKGAEIDTELTAVASAISSKADVNSPALTGTPTAPTASAGTNTTQLATTAFVNTGINGERTATATLTNKTLTSPTINTPTISGATITGGSVSSLATDIAVADGGTGAGSFTANSIVLGNGTSALNGNMVAPGTSGNILQSNGTTWTSATPPFTKSAWLYYDSGIISSYNIASVTNPGTGLYTVTFTNAFSDANYMVLGTGQANSSATTPGIVSVTQNTVSKAAGSLQINRARTDGAGVENGPFYVYFFGN
jgi:hypothetical protein